MDDSPLKTFEEIRQKIETSLVTLLGYFHNAAAGSFSLEEISKNSISFYALSISTNELIIGRFLINSDNTITYTVSNYLLTPAT